MDTTKCQEFDGLNNLEDARMLLKKRRAWRKKYKHWLVDEKNEEPRKTCCLIS